MKNLLKEGDVIVLEKGMKVYGLIPEMFIYSNRKTSDELVNHDIVVGQVYENDTEIEKSIVGVVNNVHAAFEHEGFKIELSKVSTFVRGNIPQPTPQRYALSTGKFVVVKTSFEGGSHGTRDDYPDGHRVYCKRLRFDGKYEPEGEAVNFYQSGCFSAMIEEIEPVSQMKKEESYSLTFS